MAWRAMVGIEELTNSRQRAPAELELGPIRPVHGRPPIVPGCSALHFVGLRLGKDRTLEFGTRIA
jgi:hypothetical protein